MIWFDFENAPHVLFWYPLIRYFQEMGMGLELTARDFSYTGELLKRLDLKYYLCRKGASNRGRCGKYASVLSRASELWWRVKKGSVELAISFGSRAQIIASKLNGFPVISSEDYEYANMAHVGFTEFTLVPDVIPATIFGSASRKIVHYPGFKEEMYLHQYQPKEDLKNQLGLNDKNIIVLFRPGDYRSHYQSGNYLDIEKIILDALISHRKSIQVVLLPRNKEQRGYLTSIFEKCGVEYVIPERIYFGPDLIWQGDLVIGGGGTMLREACALNIPAYTFFSGKIGHVDRHYCDHQKMFLIQNCSDVDQIKLIKCSNKMVNDNPLVLNFFRDFILNYLDRLRSR